MSAGKTLSKTIFGSSKRKSTSNASRKNSGGGQKSTSSASRKNSGSGRKSTSSSGSTSRKSGSRKRTGSTTRRRKGSKRSKRWIVRIGKYKVGLTVFCIIAAVAVIFCFSITQMVKGSYEGLGEKQEIVGNPYKESKFYTGEDGLLRYEDKKYTSKAGIDVSLFQKEIDWEKVKASGVEFVMIRVGYRSIKDGKIRMDNRFKEYLKGAKDAGLEVGVYFFSQARSADEAVEEAKYVIRHIRGKGITMPVAYDMEYLEGDRISDLTAEERTEAADAFCSIIEQNDLQPIVYGNPTWFVESIDKEYLEKYPTWLAHYTENTGYEGDFSMWQYSETGKIDGIKKKVDLDILFVEKE